MFNFEIYLLLFTDSLTSNLAFNTSSEMAIIAMKTFGLYNPYKIIITASLAYFVSIIINYFFGRVCYKILINKEEKTLPYSYPRILEFRKPKYLFILLLLSALPFFGKFIILFTGFCQVKFSRVIYGGTLVKVIYYAYFILS